MAEVTTQAGGAGASGRIILIEGEAIIFDTPILRRTPASVPAVIPALWAERLLDAFETTTLPGWEALLVDEETFRASMASPAIAGYADFLNPDKVSKRGHTGMFSTALHAAKLKASYQKLKEAIDFLAHAGRELFEAKVAEAQDAYRAGAALPLTWTGDYVTNVLGAAVRQWWFINSDLRLNSYRWATDYTEGKWPPEKPFLLKVPKWDLARRHQNLLVQGGVLTLARIKHDKTNENLDEWLSTWLTDDYLPPPDSFIRVQQIPEGLGIRTYLSFLPPP